jgi:hypothetical protein
MKWYFQSLPLNKPVLPGQLPGGLFRDAEKTPSNTPAMEPDKKMQVTADTAFFPAGLETSWFH